jgi:hypothetical protein
MYKTVEATYRNGHFFPTEPLHVTSSDRVLLTVIPGGKRTIKPDEHTQSGSFKGKLSGVDEFASAKVIQKELELSLISVVDSSIAKIPFRPQDYAGTLKLADAEAEIRTMRNEWERF